MPLQSYIDQPADWSHLARCVIIRGWGFAAPGGAIAGIRLRTTDRELHGVVGLPRPDVKAACPDAPDDHVGFEIRGTLPSGRQRLLIEARLADGSWEPVMDQTVRIKRQATALTDDDFCAQLGLARLDFVKLHVDGHEWPILQGFR